MKKIFLFLLLLTLPCLVGWQTKTTYQEILHRDAVSADDTAVTSDTVDLAGYGFARVDFDIGGTGTPSWSATPCCSNDTVWVEGDSETISEDSWYIIESGGCKEFAVKLDSKSGTSPTMSVWVTPFNR